MAEVKLDVVLKDAYGKDFSNGENGITMEFALYQALVAQTEKDKDIKAEEKYKRHKITERIVNKKTVDLTAEEITLLKARVGEVWGVSLMGAVWDILDPVKKK